MPHHTPRIVWCKGLSKQDYYVWCHVECFAEMAEKVNYWIRHNPGRIKRVKINALAKQV
jgi:hypothetical protein